MDKAPLGFIGITQGLIEFSGQGLGFRFLSMVALVRGFLEGFHATFSIRGKPWAP